MNTPLTLTCDDCDGEGQVYRSRGGGNDPDGWLVRCAYCDGQGTVTPRCDGRFCHTVADETIRWPTGEVEHYCSGCAGQARTDALIVNIEETLDAIETLTTWCREHVRPPPADLLYRAAHAVDCLRDAMAREREAA